MVDFNKTGSVEATVFDNRVESQRPVGGKDQLLSEKLAGQLTKHAEDLQQAIDRLNRQIEEMSIERDRLVGLLNTPMREFGRAAEPLQASPSYLEINHHHRQQR